MGPLPAYYDKVLIPMAILALVGIGAITGLIIRLGFWLFEHVRIV